MTARFLRARWGMNFANASTLAETSYKVERLVKDRFEVERQHLFASDYAMTLD